ncbi:hypothetical protein [Leptospira alstonii]|uniref:Uncharacterized protein n=1 Tax=Leptospira alstonii serovar Sichuan str. 79601 TaxID=1218565 RepID=M6CUI7_9LEPT|nr:hypothetical protein [Leptospira alstonii]AGS80475.1 hypothetical protein LEP1GSC193_0724 [Leptospira phage vB_LalZ_80412-LE1]EMJ95384.1 hypothetical protein LEP1GSC194_3524 [Leptospira alstonii serovar Sichuan str. 79601]
MQETNKAPVSCDKCLEFLGQVARVFPSEEHLKDPQYMQNLGLKYLGEDKFSGDSITEIAVWPAKSNGNLKYSKYRLCCPVHPNCSHEYEYIDIEKEEKEDDDEIGEIFREGRLRDAKARLRTDYIYEQNAEANEEWIQLERMYGPIKKSGVFRVGVWEEPTCSEDSNKESWLIKYIDWKLKTI